MPFWRTVQVYSERFIIAIKKSCCPPYFQAIFITSKHWEGRREEDRLMMWSTLQKGRWCSQATEEAPADTLQFFTNNDQRVCVPRLFNVVT